MKPPVKIGEISSATTAAELLEDMAVFAEKHAELPESITDIIKKTIAMNDAFDSTSLEWTSMSEVTPHIEALSMLLCREIADAVVDCLPYCTSIQFDGCTAYVAPDQDLISFEIECEELVVGDDDEEPAEGQCTLYISDHGNQSLSVKKDGVEKFLW